VTPLRLILVLAIVLAALTALYRYADLKVDRAARFSSALTALRLHDAELNRDLLRLRAGNLLHYDSVNAAMSAIEADLDTLASHSGPLRAEIVTLTRLARQKSVWLERFKSSHALVRNSLDYFLYLQEPLSNRYPQLAELGASMLRFVRQPSLRHRQHIEQLLTRFPVARGELAPLQSHTRLLLDRLPQRERLLAELLGTPLESGVNRLAAIHQATLNRLQQRSDTFRLALFLAAVAFFIQLLLAWARLQQANRRLQQEMRQRLEAERKLLQAQKMEALGALASGLAHDFNNLLSGIRGYVVLGQEQINDGQAPANALSRIETIVERGRELAQRLLQFARPGSGTAVPFEPAEVVEEALNLIRSSLPSGVKLDFHHELPPNCRVQGHPGELQQVVINLVCNAADAVEGDGRVEVDLKAGSDMLILQVRDNGHGIEAEKLPTIFDPFVSGKPAHLGSGLGLAIVDRIVQTHGGHIEVATHPGEGTTFTLQLPWRMLQR